MLLWLCCRPAAAAPILPLAWELPYAVGVAPRREKKKVSPMYLSNARMLKEIKVNCVKGSNSQIKDFGIMKPEKE